MYVIDVAVIVNGRFVVLPAPSGNSAAIAVAMSPPKMKIAPPFCHPDVP
jgi:hypothetical protein